MIGNLGLESGGAAIGAVRLKIRLHQPGTGGVVWPCPALAVVPFVPEGVEVLLMTGRRYVQRLAGHEIHPGRDGMNMHTASLLPVQNGGIGVAVRLQAGKGQPLPVVQDSADLLVGRGLLRCPADHAAGVGAGEVQAIRHGGHSMGIAPQYLHIGPVFALVVVVGQQVRHRSAATAALYRLAVPGELMVHRRPPQALLTGRFPAPGLTSARPASRPDRTATGPCP